MPTPAKRPPAQHPAAAIPGSAGVVHPLTRAVFLALFAISGSAGLVYEVVWVRQITLVLGASTYAVTIVLAVFMAGLGIGAWLLGKIADRLEQRGLVACYVGLELGLAAYASILPGLLQAGQEVYAWLYRGIQPGLVGANGIRLLLAFSLLIVPATLMGATLPVLSRFVIRNNSQIALSVSRLYGVNTLGALLGTMAAGYLLLPHLGIRNSTWVAAGMNVLVATAFWAASRATARPGSHRPEAGNKARPAPRIDRPLGGFQIAVAAGFALSGAASMFYEVAWTRTLTLIVGTTTFSFTTMLATFLLGIALGSLFFRGFSRLGSPAQLFVAAQYAAAFTAVLTIPLLEKLPFVYLSLYGLVANHWLGVQVLRFVLAGLVMLLPTCALGLTFPAVSAMFVDDTGVLGRRLGKAYAFNTLGAVLGAVLGGLLLVPAIGMQGTVIAGAALNAASGSLVALRAAGRPLRQRALGAGFAALAFVALVLSLKPWSPWIMSSGVYVYADRYHKMLDRVQSAGVADTSLSRKSAWALWEMAMKQYELLFFRTGPTATVAVMQGRDGVRFMTVDGKTDASTGAAHDMKTQVMLAQLPLLFHPAPDKVFVVGLGSGVTAGSVLTHEVRVVDCAELSQAVIEASACFDDVNHRPLADRRLRLLRRDARNVLLTSPETYDLIISQPSNPWIAGQSSLFSRDWYQLVQRRLRPGGWVVQWLPAYQMSEDDIKTVIHTMRSVFPHATLWTSGAPGDVILIGKQDRPMQIDWQLLQQRLERPPVARDLARIGAEPLRLPYASFVMNEDELDEFLRADPDEPLRLNTDDLLVTEYSSPRDLASGSVAGRFATLERLVGHPRSLEAMLVNGPRTGGAR